MMCVVNYLRKTITSTNVINIFEISAHARIPVPYCLDYDEMDSDLEARFNPT